MSLADIARSLGLGKLALHLYQNPVGRLKNCLREGGPLQQLRERWLNYPNLRKLTDPHVGTEGWKLVLDSDLLFFRQPDFLPHWLEAPNRPLHAIDSETSYGYSRPLMYELAGAPVRDLINVGLTGLDSGEPDSERLEAWFSHLISRERTSYYLEQTLVAMLVAGRKCAIARPSTTSRFRPRPKPTSAPPSCTIMSPSRNAGISNRTGAT